MNLHRLALAAAVVLAPRAAAGMPFDPGAEAPEAPESTGAPPAALQGAEIVEHLGDPLPMDLLFTDSTGARVRLGDLVGRGGRPALLMLVYYDCPMLCGLALSGLTRALAQADLELGRDYDLATLSFDSREKPGLAAERKGHYLQSLGRPEAGASWSFLVGEDAAIRALANAVGFSYRRDEKTGQWAHVAVAMALTPDGRVSRYLYGIQFSPRDLKLALVEASNGEVGATLDRVLLTCFRWDPATRRYALFLSLWFKIGGALVLGTLGYLLANLWRREARRGQGASVA